MLILILVIISPGSPIAELTILRTTSSSNPNHYAPESPSNPTAFHTPINPASSAPTKKKNVKKKRKLDSSEESRTKPDGSSTTKSKSNAKDSNVLSFSRFMEKVRPGQFHESQLLP